MAQRISQGDENAAKIASTLRAPVGPVVATIARP